MARRSTIVDRCVHEVSLYKYAYMQNVRDCFTLFGRHRRRGVVDTV
jgi:hypothetical protein